MPYDPHLHHRRSIRWEGYEYSSRGLYFVTVCTHFRLPFLSLIEGGKSDHTAEGEIARCAWIATPERFPAIELGPFVIMPNHVHGIVANVGATGLGEGSSKEGAASSAPTLGTIMRAFKSISAIAINKQRHSPGKPVWQRNYYEHVIRDGREFGIISRYIWENPARWEFDPENLSCRTPDTAQPWEIHKP